MRIFESYNKFFYFDASWDWRWFGFELSINNHDKYLNICFTWLQICIYFGKG